MKHSNHITDKTWLSILAGKLEADDSNIEQVHLKRLRELLLKQDGNISKKELTKELKEEKSRLFNRMEKEGLFAPVKIPFYKKIFNFSLGNKYIIPPLIIISLSSIFVFQFLINDNSEQNKQVIRMNSDLPEGMVYKNIEDSDAQVIVSKDPNKKFEEIKNSLEKSGVFNNIEVTKSNNSYTIIADINLERTDTALEILNRQNIVLPKTGHIIKLNIKKR